MKNSSRTTLFLMEQLIVILIFAICAAVCVKIFVGSYTMVSDSRDKKNSLIVAESGAECYKALGGDADKIAMYLDGTATGSDEDGVITVYYNKSWQACEGADADYLMQISSRESEEYGSLLFGDISVEKVTGEEIISLTVCARGSAYE